MAETPETIVLALKRFKLAAEAREHQLEREIDALTFQVPELQWPDEVKQQRAAQTVAGVPIPARPMLSIPTLDQPIQLVLNQERQARLGVTVHPLSEDATDDTAEMLQGLYRRIEVDSRANLARTWAFDRAVKCGRGVYRVLTEPDPDSDHPTDQKIVIKRLLRQANAYFDPFAEEPDWSDGDWAFVVEDVPFATFTRRYPHAQVAGMDNGELTSLATEAPGWVGGSDDTSRVVRVAEYWRKEHTARKESGVDPATGQPWTVTRDEVTVYWSTIDAIEELEPEQEWNGRYIPLIPVVGRELQPFDAERRWMGIVEPNKDAARLFNYAASSAVEIAALEPKAPFVGDPEQFEGYEAWWQQANTRNFPYLPANLVVKGQVLSPPQRVQVDTGRLGPSMLLIQQARDFVHTGTGAYEPTLGQDAKQAKSGRAVLALQQQHDQGNSHWLDNLADISMTYEAKVVLDLIPQVYDRPGRVARILDLEDNPQAVILNQPFAPDPQTGRPRAVPATPSQVADKSNPIKHYDLSKGRYGVVVSIGKSYKSRADQGADELGQLFQAEPALFQILGDIYLKFRDFPGHREASERVKKMLPPQLQEQQGQQDAQQQTAQMQAQLQAQGQQLQQAVQYIQTEQAKHEATLKQTEMQETARIEIERMKNATALAVAKINALAKGVVIDKQAEDEAVALHEELSHEAAQAEHDRQHEAAMAAMQHEQAKEMGVQQGAQQAALADQGHAQELETGQAGHEQALEQAQQSAELAPEPVESEA